MRVEKPGERKYLKALIYGPSGHGKTTFLGTAQADPRTYPMLYVDFEGGEQSLVGLDIDMVTVRDWRDWDEIYNDLVNGKTEYRSIGLDSISETHVFTLLDILDKEAPNRKDPNQLQQQDYGKATILLRRLLRAFRDLPMHVFMIASAKDEDEPRIGRVKKPALAGQLAEELAGLMDVVTYLAVSKNDEGEDIRSLLLKNISQFRVKVRTGWGVTDVPDYIDEEEPRAFAERGVSILLDALNYPQDGEKPSRKRRKK